MKDKMIIHMTVSLGTGLGTFLKQIINYQVQEGYTVGLCTYGIEDKKVNEFIKDLPNNIELFNINSSKIKKKVKKGYIIEGIPIKILERMIDSRGINKEVIIHAHNPVSIGIKGSLKRYKYKLICTLHGSRQNKPHVRLPEKIILKNLIKNNTKIIAVSNHTAQVFNRAINSNLIEVIHNGIDIKNNKNKDKYYNEQFNIGFVSHLSKPKGWEKLFDAFVLLNNKYPNKFRLTIAGNGDEENIEKLKSKIHENNFLDEVTYLGYMENASDTVIPKLDVLVLPSINEGFGLVLIEAMAQNIPVIASADGGMKEIVRDYYNGLLLYDITCEEIIEKIEYMFINKDQYEIMKKNAMSTYIDKFSIQKMVKKYNYLYES